MKKQLLKIPCWKFTPCRRFSILESENKQLKDSLKEFLSPKDEKGRVLKDGCSDRDYSFRLYVYIKKLYKGNNDCPFMACRQWIDNMEFENCARIAAHVSNLDGGWDEKKVAKVLGDKQVNFDEIKALKKLREGAGELLGGRKK